MDDLISKQAVIDMFKSALCSGKRECAISYKGCEDIINSLPSVQEWIPVTEALPKDDEEVIVTCLDDSGDTPFSYTTVAWHYKGMWICGNFVIAWMPLPDPYKGTEE